MEALIRDMWGDPRNEFRRPLYIFFYLLSLPYGAAVRARNRLFDLGALPQRDVGCPVVSVGNLTAGGTGKTPMAIRTAGMLRDRGMRPAVLSRGYGGRSTAPVLVVSDGRQLLAGPDEAGDEPVLIARRLPGVPVLAGPKRAVTGRYAREHLGADVLVLDDGFQHRWIRRDLDIVLLDSRRPLGNGHLLPRGPLREPPASLERAGVVVLTRSGERGDAPGGALAGLLAGRPVLRARIRPTKLVAADGTEMPLPHLAGRRVFAFAGIARPESFRRTLEGLGACLAGFRALPDHHRYTAEDVRQIGRALVESGAEILVTTEKDGVKLSGLAAFPRPLFCLAIETEILEGADALETAFRVCLGAR
ncbi:MAG: Tetraacyldisaccharide 4'-kinase [Syntrophaceae bacterium PtaB.Bin038]|nr:MAG: Tetraacyldisaccharide 4'-kinase [Syntrophaceae bacterium PtaB.Bin038]